jgi:hypothetical protein
MALCQYCGKVEIAWKQLADKRWVAYHAQRDASGAVVRKAERSGTRSVNRPVPDVSKRHYPHEHYGIMDAMGNPMPRGASECPEWTPQAAAASRKMGSKRAWRSRAPAVVTSTAAVAVAPMAMPMAEPIPTAGIGEDAPTAPAPQRVKEPEELMDAADIAAWARAESIIRCAIIPTRVLLWGPPGTGKTEMPWRIAQAEGWTHVYQLMTEETPATELLGHLIVQGGSTVWCDGTLGRAIRASHTGHVVYVVDEIARASQDAMSACLLALTNPESLRLTLRSGEVIEPKPEHWHVVATSNDEPSILPPALQDRLHMAVRLLAPHPGLIRSMTTAEARQLAASKAREYSVRALLTYDRLRAGGMSLEDAAAMVWEPEVCTSFVDAARLEGGYANTVVRTWNPCGHNQQKCPKCKGPCCGRSMNDDYGCFACAKKAGKRVNWSCDKNPNFWVTR